MTNTNDSADTRAMGASAVTDQIISLLEASAAAWEDMAGNFPNDADASGRMIARANESRGNVERIRTIFAQPESRAAESKDLPAVNNTLAGFRGGFIGVYGRAPTEQEIWNGAVRSGMDRARYVSIHAAIAKGESN